MNEMGEETETERERERERERGGERGRERDIQQRVVIRTSRKRSHTYKSYTEQPTHVHNPSAE